MVIKVASERTRNPGGPPRVGLGCRQADARHVCTINEANMGIQVAAIARRYTRQMMAKAAAGQTDGTVQMGINLEKMMANQKAAAEECTRIFGVEKAENFTSPRTERGDQLVMEAHKAARAAIREVCPQVKVGLTLSLHDIQALPGGEENAAKEWAAGGDRQRRRSAIRSRMALRCLFASMVVSKSDHKIIHDGCPQFPHFHSPIFTDRIMAFAFCGVNV